MAVSDFLSEIGKGLATTGRVVGTVAPELAKGIANEEAGYAPEIAKEKRQHQTELEDAQLNAKAQDLENRLEMGRKYGTLSPDDQQQYVDAITQLYSHPRHAGTLMEKLRKAVHPDGATYTPGALSTLKNSVPEGGTAAADAKLAGDKRGVHPVPGVKPFKGPDGLYYQPMYDGQGKIVNEQIEGYVPPPVKSGGKSPPLTGDKLPSDAVGANGEPIPEAERNAGKSFVEFGGAWWPVAKQKPVLKKVQGHLVLVDPTTGAKLRDIGSVDSTKVTTRQTLQPGDDGQMHLVNLTSVTAPGGEQIDVTPETESGAPEAGGGNTAPSPAAKPKGVGGILKPKTQAKPVTTPPGGPSAGKVVPGLRTLAASKNPLFKSDVAQYTKVAEDANAKTEAYESAKKAIASTATPSSDQELIYSWVRSNVQGAGRMTQAEFIQARSIGSLPQKAQNWIEMSTKGTLTPEIRGMMFADIKRSAETAQAEAKRLRPNPTGEGGDNKPAGIKINRDDQGRIIGIE